MGTSVAHIDASPILVLVFREDGLDDMRRMFYRMKGNSFRVVISQLVLGEIVVQILERNLGYEGHMECFRRLYEIFSEYNIDVQSCLPNVSAEACRIMRQIRENDPLMNENDAMILAQALVDRDSVFFLTNDQRLLKNDWLREYERGMRDRGERTSKLKITASI